ncbi:MAG TPA: hypothetical protein VIY26_15480, partial [Acidimicrobiales bacterium]
MALALVALPIFSSSAGASLWTPPASPSTTAPFNECPAIGDSTAGCAFLIILQNSGATVVKNTAMTCGPAKNLACDGPFDGNDDTLVGILNETSVPIPTVGLSSNTDIFAFDGDGICSNSSGSPTYGNWVGQSGCPYPNGGAPPGYTSVGYEGPGTYFSNYTPTTDNFETGNVNFTGGGLAAGSDTFFSLESALNTASFTIPADFTVAKTASPSAGVIAGSGTPIVYQLTAKNVGGSAGDVTITDTVPTGTTYVAGTDTCPLLTGSETCSVTGTGTAASPFTWTIDNVAVGASVTVGFSVTANASDATGTISNTGYWTGPGCTTASPGCPVGPVTTPVTAETDSMSVAKTVNAGAGASAGPISISGPTTLTYGFAVTNTGNVPLSKVSVSDTPFSGLTAITCGTNTNGSFSLAVRATVNCTATDAVSQAAIDAGTPIVDTATATASTPTAGQSATAQSNTVTVNITQTNTLMLTKSASVTSVSAAGQTFTYDFLVKNTGNTDLSNIAIQDAQSVATEDANLTGLTCLSATLAPQASETCTATYKVSQADMDAGVIADTATATGTLNGATITSNQSGATVSATQNGAITITKSANVASVSAPGTVTYTFTVTNTGTVSLSGASITDNANFSGLSALSCTSPTTQANGSIALAVGASETCTATESVTQAQI